LVIGDLAAVQASLEAKYTAANGSNGAAAAHGSSNGAAAPLASASIDAADGVDGFLPPEQAGQLEAAAQEALAEREAHSKSNGAAAAAAAAAPAAAAAAAASLSAKGTPYAEPGGRWSQFKTYSTFQRTWEIWSFGLTFFFKLWWAARSGAASLSGACRWGLARPPSLDACWRLAFCLVPGWPLQIPCST
jgi:hypothetical protein